MVNGYIGTLQGFRAYSTYNGMVFKNNKKNIYFKIINETKPDRIPYKNPSTRYRQQTDKQYKATQNRVFKKYGRLKKGTITSMDLDNYGNNM